MTGDDSSGVPPAGEEPARSRQREPETSPDAHDPGYLVETGEAAGEDGSVAPIIGGLPAVEGSAWDIGAARDERGAGLAEEQEGPSGQASREGG